MCEVQYIITCAGKEQPWHQQNLSEVVSHWVEVESSTQVVMDDVDGAI